MTTEGEPMSGETQNVEPANYPNLAFSGPGRRRGPYETHDMSADLRQRILAAERERADTAEAKIAAVRAVIDGNTTPPASSSQIDAGIRAADRDWTMRLRAALDTPREDIGDA